MCCKPVPRTHFTSNRSLFRSWPPCSNRYGKATLRAKESFHSISGTFTASNVVRPPNKPLYETAASRRFWLAALAAGVLALGIFWSGDGYAAPTPRLMPKPPNSTPAALPTVVPNPSSFAEPQPAVSATVEFTASPSPFPTESVWPEMTTPHGNIQVSSENGVGIFGLVVIICIVALLNLGAGFALWHFLLRPVQRELLRHREKLNELELTCRQFAGDLINMRREFGQGPALSKKVAQLESSINQLADEFASRLDPSGQPLPTQAGYTRPASSTQLGIQNVERRNAAVENFAAYSQPPGKSPPDASSFPIAAPVLPSREQLGALFVQEISVSSGTSSIAVWDRCFTRIQTYFRDASCQSLHWDRSAAVPRFQARPSGEFTDTGECWLVQADAQALLFFPALAQAHARKSDLPGCQIISSGGVLLDASRLAIFTPPVAVPASEGWTIQQEGIVEYH